MNTTKVVQNGQLVQPPISITGVKCTNHLLSSKTRSLDTIGINLSLEGKTPVSASVSKYRSKLKRKAITKSMMYSLFGLQNSPSLDDYRQSYKCNDYLFQDGDKVTSNYCQKRCCLICSTIKTQQLLESYGAQILALNDTYMVTLTNKNVTWEKGINGIALSTEINLMIRTFQNIKNNIRKSKIYSHLEMSGFRTVECTVSRKKGFNPHLHLIVTSKETAMEIVRLWLDAFPMADRKGQKIEKSYGGEKGLLELFKYIAKPIASGFYSAKAYDSIYTSFKGVRSIQSFGTVKKHKSEDIDEMEIERLQSQNIDFQKPMIQVWKWQIDNWYSPDNEPFVPTKGLDRKTKSIIRLFDNCKEYEIELPVSSIFKRARDRIRNGFIEI